MARNALATAEGVAEGCANGPEATSNSPLARPYPHLVQPSSDELFSPTRARWVTLSVSVISATTSSRRKTRTCTVQRAQRAT